MKIAAIGEHHPLAAALKALLPSAELLPWGDPGGDTGSFDGLVFMAPPWANEPADPKAVLIDLEVLWAWLHPWTGARRERGGVLLYVTSLDGICGSADNVLLAERDSAMLAQARAMAMELGKFGIRSNCLALGPLGKPEDTNDLLSKNQLKRVGTWDEAAKTAAFLLGDASAHVTGQLLVCAGGADIGRIVP